VKARTSFASEEAWMLGWVLGVDWDRSDFDLDEFQRGLDRELELQRRAEGDDETHLDPIRTARTALANLQERPGYYSDTRAPAEPRAS
jgi:hypothetical protein